MVRLAPGQLDFIAWGLIHSFQVLSDLSGIDVTTEMIDGAFRFVPLVKGSRRFTLTSRERGRPSPVHLPWHLVPSLYGFYTYHNRHIELVSCLSRAFPRNDFPCVEFPGNLHRLSSIFLGSAFLLRDELISRSSLGMTLDKPFVRSGEMSLLV